MSARQCLIYWSIMFKGDWDQIYRKICEREYPSKEEMDKVTEGLTCNAVTFVDPEYPEYLKSIFKPPFVLYYEGDISLLSKMERHIAIVGSRDVDPLYVRETRKIVQGLKEDLVIVSGMASGIDGTAHRAAIEFKRKTIAVLGCGIDICFPIENRNIYYKIKKYHLMISEYPPGTPPIGENFPKRNRIVVGLSKVVFVPAATKKSGSMISVAIGLEHGKDILCLPSVDFVDSGCNFCIKSGAYLVENADDINDFFPG